MKLSTLWLVGSLSALVAVTGCKKDAPAAGTTAADEDPDWEKYSSAEGKYTARFLKGFKEETRQADGVTWYQVKSEIGAYAVHYADFADEAAAKAALNEFADTLKSRSIKDEPITQDGHEGRMLTVTISAEATMWTKIFTVGKRFYKVSAGNKNRRETADKFFNWFKLTG